MQRDVEPAQGNPTSGRLPQHVLRVLPCAKLKGGRRSHFITPTQRHSCVNCSAFFLATDASEHTGLPVWSVWAALACAAHPHPSRAPVPCPTPCRKQLTPSSAWCGGTRQEEASACCPKRPSFLRHPTGQRVEWSSPAKWVPVWGGCASLGSLGASCRAQPVALPPTGVPSQQTPACLRHAPSGVPRAPAGTAICSWSQSHRTNYDKGETRTAGNVRPLGLVFFSHGERRCVLGHFSPTPPISKVLTPARPGSRPAPSQKPPNTKSGQVLQVWGKDEGREGLLTFPLPAALGPARELAGRSQELTAT